MTTRQRRSSAAIVPTSASRKIAVLQLFLSLQLFFGGRIHRDRAGGGTTFLGGVVVGAARAQVHRNVRFLDDSTPTPLLIGYKMREEPPSNNNIMAGREGTASQQPRSPKLASAAELLWSSSSRQGRSSSSSKRGAGLARVNAAKAALTKAQLQQLLDLHDDDLLYVEADSLVKPLAELTPYGVPAIQADGSYPPNPDAAYPPGTYDPQSACSNPNSFKIGIVDSGIDVRHPDLPCFYVNDTTGGSANCVGEVFGLGLTDAWDSPSDIHGTFVSGIISAIRGNGLGVTGVLNNDNVCLIMARVFGGSVEEARLSDILEAVDWVAQQGAQVINLSLGGPDESETARNLYQSIRDENRLVFCASGNDGSSTFFYPASYNSTVSVGAVDASLQRASFSQYNSQVDLVAPGASILSTAPLGLGALYQLDANAGSATYDTVLFQQSVPPPTSGLTGTLVDCPNLAQNVCPGDSSGAPFLCLIERGTSYFEDKAFNCQQGGGIAAIIYNNEPGLYSGGLDTPTQVTIPVFAVSQDTGLALLQNGDGTSVSLVVMDGYAIADGTSFASPYAAGAAASIWQSCPSCSNDQVEACLLSTARDLGSNGLDDQYGHGLVQVQDAYLCLVNTAGCCTLGENPSPAAAGPTSPATPSPVFGGGGDGSGSSDVPCETQDAAYKQCFADGFDNVVERAVCRSCVNGVLPNDLTSVTCEELMASVCGATRGGCDCASCSSSIEAYLACSLAEVKSDCIIDCDQYEAATDNNAASSSTVTLQYCTVQQSAMETCLQATPSGTNAPQQDNSCGTCVLNSIPRSVSGENCRQINGDLCPVVEDCQCSQCTPQIDAFLDCVIDTNTAGCTLDCNGTSFNDSTSAAPWPLMFGTVQQWILVFGLAVGALIL